MTSEIRTNTLKNRVGLGTITLTSTGTIVSGISTFSGDVHIDGDELFIADSIKHSGDTNTVISFPSNDTINFRTDGSERLRITSDGKVGIGTNNPSRKLDLHESSSSGNFISITNDTTGHGAADGALIGLQDDESLIISNKENNHIEFHTDNDERLRILSNGNVSVGSNGAAAEKFQVNGGNIAIVGGSAYKIDTHLSLIHI